MKRNFCFILNPLEVSGEMSFEIIPNHFLQKASLEQIEVIKRKLIGYTPNVWLMPPYEYEWQEVSGPDGGGKSRQSAELQHESWRYWVITYEGVNVQTHTLELAANLLYDDLDFGWNFVFMPDGRGLGAISYGASIFSFLESNKMLTSGNGVTKIQTEDLAAIGKHFHLITECEKTRPHIYKALSDFFMLKSLPRQSSMLVLGYFAVMEALVTHDPKDDFDSLSHQISTKMNLLSKRFERRLDFEGHFSQVTQAQIWKKLYGYRSALAHGTAVDFKTKFQVLKDHANVQSFLKEGAKLTLLFAMKEPELSEDLNQC